MRPSEPLNTQGTILELVFVGNQKVKSDRTDLPPSEHPRGSGGPAVGQVNARERPVARAFLATGSVPTRSGTPCWGGARLPNRCRQWSILRPGWGTRSDQDVYDIVVVFLIGQAQSGPAIADHCIHVGPGIEQGHNGFGVTSTGRVHQGGHASVACCIHVGPGVEQDSSRTRAVSV